MSLIDKSFYLIRTNPALTGNVKIVTSKNNKIYLESFNANRTLKKDRFKHFEVKKEEFYKEAVSSFFEGVENKIIFEVRDLNDKSTMYNDYRFQFDDTYFSGAQFVEDNFYQEEYEYTAPLYIKNDKLPTDFIILRVDGSGSLTVDSDKENFRDRIIDQWKFVDSFDLTEESTFGEWLKRNFVDDVGFPQYPMEIKHGDIDLSTISGIDTELSGWITKSLNLYETQTKNTPIFKTEEFFTKIWEDNNLLYPHILNFKFLFDDTPASPTTLNKYSINRYVGFYVDEKVEVQNISPFKGFELNVANIQDIEGLDLIEASQIPYVRNNVFVREVDGRYYSFDPIKNGWDNSQTYWIEWKQQYYRLERIVNTVEDIFAPDVIIGDYLYRIVSDTTIERSDSDIANDVDNCTEVFSDEDKNIIQRRVTINDLGNDYNGVGTTYKDRITITPEKTFNNITANNIVENSDVTLIKFKRVYNCVTIDGIDKYLFTLELVTEDNKFEIENYNEADLHLIVIEDNKYVIKRYDDDVVNVGGKYYINTDYALDVNEREIKRWINNGNISLDPEFYDNRAIEAIKPDGTIPFFKIYRINLTDIKDFDFDRAETTYTRYEYEKKYEVKQNIEPKLYAKEYRTDALKINTLVGDKARREPVLDINGRPLNLRDQRGELNIFTGQPYTDEELYFKNADGTWKLFEGELEGTSWYDYDSQDVSLAREFYREEDYVWKEEDENENVLGSIDFRPNSDKKTLYEELTWGADGKSEYSDEKVELPEINSADPNENPDVNYIPVSSEYINSDELWELRDNDLTPIWDKNQSVCKWGFLNSLGKMDLPYRLNYSLDLDDYNREPNMNTNRNFPQRGELNLDYFYRFGLKDKESYQYYTLHLNESYFDIDKYFSQDFDYFEYLLKSDQLTSDGIEITRKYSLFNVKDEFTDPETVFRGIKFNLLDVEEIVIDEEELAENNNLLIEDIITNANQKYKDYKFSIVFGRKLSNFENNSGNGNSNLGMDIYLNDKWKNVLVHIYINTDEVLQITDPNTGLLVNAETCEIDFWYEDNIDTRDINPTQWDNFEFKINNFGIGLRPRDTMLWEFINVLENYNYEPSTVSKEQISFIHIYEDGTHNIMDYSNTDFILDSNEPTEVLSKDDAFKTTGVSDNDIPDFDINNSVENRIIVDDDPNNPFGDPNFTSEGLEVDSLNDINSYNDYPIAKVIEENNVDTRLSWELDDDTDPSIYRYNGIYVPMFKEVPLFRPYGYTELKESTNNIPTLPDGNWKFYDPDSSASNPNVIGFGIIEELLFSKCNNVSSVLKIQDPDEKEKSVYPMVDEYGYDFDARYIFTANWEPGWHYISKLIEIPENDKNTQAGFTVHYDGDEEFLRIPDSEKFNQENYIVEDSNFANYILLEPTGERSFFNDNINDIVLDNDGGKDNIRNYKFIANTDYKISLETVTFSGGNPDYTMTVYAVKPNSNEKLRIFKWNRTRVTGLDFKFNFDTSKYDYGEESLDFDSNPTNKLHYIDDTRLADSGYTKTAYSGNFTGYSLKDLPKDYIEDNLINIQIEYGLQASSTSTARLSMKVRFDIIEGGNLLDISTDNWYLENNKNNELGDILLGGFIRKNDETGDILKYPAFSRISDASTFTENELDKYKGSIGDTTWREFAGLLKPRPGRVGVAPYDYANNPFPKNWNGEVYIDILNRLRTIGGIGAGDVLETEIKNNGHFGYNSYAYLIGAGSLSADDRFDVATMFHFFEYGSQDEIEGTTNLGFGSSKFGASRILNEFYKLTGFGSTFFNRGFQTEFPNPETVSPFRILNNTPFEFEPDRNIRLNDGKGAYYIGQTEGSLTEPKVVIDWSKVYRDKRIKIDIIPKNGNRISVDAPVLHPTQGHKLTNAEIKNEINNDLLSSSYFCTGITNTGRQVEITIESANSGSYYNFDVQLKTVKDFSIKSLIKSGEQKTISEKFTKTSIRDDRRTGRITDITVEFWVRVDAWERSYETIMYKGMDTSNNIWSADFTDMTYAIGKFEDSDKLAFKTSHEKLNGSLVTHTLTSDLEINDGEWHHLAFTADLETRKKSIYVDGELDVEDEDYLEPFDIEGTPIDDDPEEREMVAQFLERRARFLPGDEHPNIGVDSTLANKIRFGSTDSNTVYWYDVIRGLEDPTFFDLEWQYKNWSTTITKAYEVFSENYKSLDYYLRVDSDTLDWDILIGTDSTEVNGNRNFEGLLDELRIWNYARSEEQINMNYRFIMNPKAYLNPLESLIAYYRFDEGLGVNTIEDLMNGNAVKDIDKWARAKTTFTFDGRKEKELDEITFYQFVNSFWEGSNIDVDDEETDWEVSGADIDGVSDERNMSSLPAPITKESLREVPPPIFKRSKRMLKKRRRRRFLFNIKIKIFRLTRTRTFKFRPTKWWLFKKRVSRIIQRKKSVKLRYRIRRKGKTWLTRYKKLIRKRRR
jgi:hypothetical protein